MNAFKPLKTEWEYIIRIVKILTLCLASILFIRVFFIDVSRVSRTSMEPTLKEHDLLLIEKISNLGKPYQRGDIVQVFNPQDGGIIVKRIAGLPGETIYNTNGTIMIKTTDHQTLALPNIPQDQLTPRFNPQILGEYEYFLLGDNRHSSIDSRVFGPVNRSNIIGRAWFIWSN